MKRSLVSDLAADSDSKRSDTGDSHGYSSSSSSSSSATDHVSVSEQFLKIELDLCEQLQTLNLIQDPITCYYNPLEYAMEPHSTFVRRHGGGDGKRILFLGMNPGPFGMAQTGVPFGDVSMVRDWLGIDEVGKPEPEHPSRPILGFQCTHKEVSGTRFWTLIKDLCHAPDTFFTHCTICNYCPLIFMSRTGKNVSVANVPKQLRSQMYDMCDRSLVKVLKLYKVRNVVCIGKFAEKRAKEALRSDNVDVKLHYLMHPSPINPAANCDWQGKARKTLEEIGLLDVIRGEVVTRNLGFFVH